MVKVVFGTEAPAAAEATVDRQGKLMIAPENHKKRFLDAGYDEKTAAPLMERVGKALLNPQVSGHDKPLSLKTTLAENAEKTIELPAGAATVRLLEEKKAVSWLSDLRDAMKDVLTFVTALLLASPVSLYAAGSAANATPKAAAETFPSHFPPFSWARAPVYQMFADDKRLLTDAEVKRIAETSDFICIEKQHGYKALGGVELGTRHENARFKALNPESKCLFYFNSAFAYPFTTYSQIFRYGRVSEKHKAFLLEDPKTGELAEREKTYHFDVLNPGFRSWWAQTVGKCVRESGADGLFVDQMHGFGWLRPRKKKEVANAQAELMRMAKASIGRDKILLLNNAANIPELSEIGDAFMFEHYEPALLTKEAIVKDWEAMKRISRAGKISVWRIGVEVEELESAGADKKRRPTDAAYEALARERIFFYLAAFLIGAQPYSYFQYGWGWRLQAGPLVDHPEFKRRLGQPLGEYTRPNPDGWVFQREFEHASVSLDLGAREGRIEWR